MPHTFSSLRKSYLAYPTCWPTRSSNRSSRSSSRQNANTRKRTISTHNEALQRRLMPRQETMLSRLHPRTIRPIRPTRKSGSMVCQWRTNLKSTWDDSIPRIGNMFYSSFAIHKKSAASSFFSLHCSSLVWLTHTCPPFVWFRGRDIGLQDPNLGCQW